MQFQCCILYLFCHFYYRYECMRNGFKACFMYSHKCCAFDPSCSTFTEPDCHFQWLLTGSRNLCARNNSSVAHRAKGATAAQRLIDRAECGLGPWNEKLNVKGLLPNIINTAESSHASMRALKSKLCEFDLQCNAVNIIVLQASIWYFVWCHGCWWKHWHNSGK